jgi:uncharacterized membrane protein YeaQ/YmgE (transglycosylase-associated protein family)
VKSTRRSSAGRCAAGTVDRSFPRLRPTAVPTSWRRTTTIGGIITAIVIGALIGALARLVLPGRQNISILLTIVVGIVAALVGTAIAKAVGVSDTPGVDWIELILQVAVAAVGVTIVGAVTGRRAR